MKCLLFNVASGANNTGNGRSAGIYRIAHHLRQHDWDVEVVDFVKEWTVEELKELTLSRVDNNTKFFGFSHMYSQWHSHVEEFCQWLKINYPNIVLISGSGVSPQFNTTVIDYYIEGFGELAIVELLKYLFSNGPRPRIEIHRVNGSHIINANSNYPAFPMRSLNVIYEDRDFIESHEWLGIEFARGCKFQCDFCNFPILGVKGDYSRDADDFEIQMRDAYDRFGVTNYLVSDETFNDRTEKITKFADVVEKLNFTPWFSGFIRPDLLISRSQDREELLRMNFLGHHYGVESFNHAAVKSVGKGMHPERVKQGLIDIKQYYQNNASTDYRGFLTLIIGLPGEPVSSWEETTSWLINNWKGQAFTPFVLEIPLGELNRKSLMSLDYKKYGFREFNGTKRTIEYQQARVSNELLIWENEHMNYYQAYDIFEKMLDIRNDDSYDFRLAPWDLAMVGLPNTMSERLQKRNSYMKNPQLNQERLQFIDRYKHKKLSKYTNE